MSATATEPTTVAAPAEVQGGLRWVLSDAAVMARRNVLRLVRAPDYLVFLTIQPVMFVLLFAYVFGGAIRTPDGLSYIDFLIPGILVQTLLFNAAASGIQLTDDLQKGIIDRFKSLPMSNSAVLAGRVVSDFLVLVWSAFLMLLVGFAIGFDFKTSFGEVVAGLALLLAFASAFSWVGSIIGLLSPNVEAAQSGGFIWLFPLTFISSAFVPADTMPPVLRAFAENNPITHAVDASRGLLVTGETGDAVWLTVAWTVGITLVAAAFAVRLYARATRKG
jgi:ABC-2 type transport system permease protein/oleandomycin transport system permease protein